MDQEPHPYGSVIEPQPVPPRRKVPKVAVAVGVTAFLALAGAGVALAAGSGGSAPGASLSASSSTSTSLPPGMAPHRGGGPRGMHALGGDRLGRDLLHGEFTIQNGTTYRTVAVQVGQVMSVSPTSITVQSADGFKQTYAVQTATVVDSQAGGISAVAGKDTVMLRALVEGTNRTATEIVDTTKVGASRHGFGLEHPKPGPQAPAGPAPAA